MDEKNVSAYLWFIFAIVVLAFFTPFSQFILATPYGQSFPNNCAFYYGTISTCTSNPVTYCGPGKYYPTTTPTCQTNANSACSAGYCSTCADCVAGQDNCTAVACGSTGYGCANICSGGKGTGTCGTAQVIGSACNCTQQCQAGLTCLGGPPGNCKAYYSNLTPNCGYYTGTNAACGSVTNYCPSGYYFPNTPCAAFSTTQSCAQETTANSCAVCGNCHGSSQNLCDTVACGTTGYGCPNVCDGVGTGGGHCLATFGTGSSCNCSGQCTSGVCTNSVCVDKYQSGTNQCGFYKGTTCTSTANNICSSSQYYPSQACSSTPTYTSCQTADTTHSCGSNTVCGMCNGTTDTCGTATCGTTYGCSGGKICDGVGTGGGHCLATFGTGSSCNCSAQCTSGVCTSGTCQAKYASGTSQCAYYTGSNPSCAAVNTYCAASSYYPTGQSCSATPTYTSCQTGYCDVCGNCAGADACPTQACGWQGTAGYTNTCASPNVCDGQGTGSSHCHALWDSGHSCYCSSECASGLVCAVGQCSPPPVITISLNSPQDATWTTSLTVTHQYTPTITNGAFLNCTLYTNHTGTWAARTGNASSIQNASLNSISYTYPSDYANVQWNVYCWNTTGTPSNYSASNYTLKIDATIPTTSATAVNSNSSSYTFGAWTNSTYINVTLSCSDATSGCNSTQYCTDASNSCPPGTAYSTPVQIITQGTSYIRYNSTDNAGGTETTKNQTIQIDSIPPTYSLNSTNSTRAGTPVQHNLYWQDNVNANGYIFQLCNGTWNGVDCLPSWGLVGWQYRKAHNITGSTGGAQTNYPVTFTVYNTTGTDTGGNVYLGSKARSDFGDVRFTNSTGSLLNYWIENTSTNYATFWVQVDSIPASPNNATIYIYYGNSAATTTSNGTSTFLAFLDKNTISLWTQYSVTGTYSSGAGSNGYWMYASSGTGGANEYWYSNAQWSNENFCVEWNAPYSQDNIRGDNEMQAGFYNGTYGAEKVGGVGSYGDASGVWWHGSHTQSGYTSDWASGTMVFGQIKKLGGTAYFHLDHSTAPVVDHSDPTTANTGPYRAWAGVYSGYWTGPVWVNVTWAWIRARGCISPEPSHGGWGSEASSPWIADNWVQFTPAMCSSSYIACWSNVTKTINSSVGANISWCVEVNDTVNNWNMTSCSNPFVYVATAPPPPAAVSSDKTSYTACGAVFYKVRLYDQNSKLINSHFTLNVINPSLSTLSSQSNLYTTNSTGVYNGSLILNTTSPVGTWLLKILENGGATGGKNFFVATACGDNICTGVENCTNCPADCRC